MPKVNVFVTLKQSVFDPQGNAVEKALTRLDYYVEQVRIGKFIQLHVPEMEEEALESYVHEVCQKVLINPEIEDYRFEVED